MDRAEDTITLIGQSKSGKTHYLSALFKHPARTNDLLVGPDAVDSAMLALLPDKDENRRLDREKLTQHFDNVLKGMDSFEGRNEGTDKARSYSAELEYTINGEEARGFLRRATPAARHKHAFSIVDGRGGDLAPSEYDDQIRHDENFQKRREEYRQAVVRSKGLIVCLTMLRDEYDHSMGERLLEEIRLARREKQSTPGASPFSFIALCLTKYETVMSVEGPMAGRKALAHGDFVETARRSLGVRQFAEVLRRGAAEGEFRTAVFPVSTFGFIGGTGAANWYDYHYASGLRTRSVNQFDFENPGLPGYRDHFPATVSQTRAMNLWKPLNLAPPLYFALTGKFTGPVMATIEELEAA